MTYWGWLLVGIALLLTALSGTQTSLCQRMRSVPVYRGLTYWEVQQIAKAAPTSFTPCGEDTIPPLGERTLPNRPALQQIRRLSGRGGRNRRIDN